MRRLITGLDGNGRSCVLEETSVAPAPVDGASGVDVARLFATDQSPLPPAAPAHGQWVDAHLAPGLLRWNVVDHHPHDEWDGPTTSTTMHHTDKIDLVLVFEGAMRLVLDDGEHQLEPGDCIVMTGGDHAMKGGPDGCRLVVASIGTPAR